jgi:hypothetical protein
MFKLFTCFNFVLTETVISKLLKYISLYSYMSLSPSGSCSYPNTLKITVSNPENENIVILFVWLCLLFCVLWV